MFQKELFIRCLNPEQKKEKSGSGQKRVIMTNKNIQKLKKLLEHKDYINHNATAKNFIIHNAYLKF